MEIASLLTVFLIVFLFKNKYATKLLIERSRDIPIYSFSACTIMGPNIFLCFNDESAAIFRAIRFETNKSILHLMIWLYTKKFNSHFLACTYSFSGKIKENVCVRFTVGFMFFSLLFSRRIITRAIERSEMHFYNLPLTAHHAVHQ